MQSDLLHLFSVLDKHATPLSEELIVEMQRRSRELTKAKPKAGNFWESPSFSRWSGLVQSEEGSAANRRRHSFLEEWHSTLQHLRDIGTTVSQPENRPNWISSSAPAGAQADQFLHAFYYQHTFDGRKANYEKFFEQNRNCRDNAVVEALDWWRQLPKAPSSEEKMLNITAPFLRSELVEERIADMTYDKFHDVCWSVHAIKDYARRVSNNAVGLPENSNGYTMEEKVAALSNRIWNDRSSSGSLVRELLHYILYDGPEQQLPERLWQGVSDPKWKLPGLGISALGELVPARKP